MHDLLESKGFPLKTTATSGGVGNDGNVVGVGGEEEETIRRVRESSTSKRKRKRRMSSESEMERTTRKLILIVLATFIGFGCLVLRSGRYNRGVHKRVDESAAFGSGNSNKPSTSAGGTATTATRRMVTATA